MSTITLCLIFVFAAAPNAANGWPLMDDDSVLIVGGDEVDITEYPHQALVLLDKQLFCGGSIISDEYILTAAHCVSGMKPNRYLVRVGSSYSNNSEEGQTYELSKFLVHPKYASEIGDYDVAVLKTAKKMAVDNRTTRIVKMADSNSHLSPGNNVVVTGWGDIMEGGPSSNVLRAVAVPVISLDVCKRTYGDAGAKVTDRMMCAGFNTDGKDACNGDSGGPAIDEKSHVQYGIVSWGFGCARKEYPGVYTSVPAVRDWITKVTGI